jgi:hypothetical protein
MVGPDGPAETARPVIIARPIPIIACAEMAMMPETSAAVIEAAAVEGADASAMKSATTMIATTAVTAAAMAASAMATTTVPTAAVSATNLRDQRIRGDFCD